MVDHFDFHPTSPATFKQRVFVYDKWWKPGGPLFFYCGNEANVELYVNATGLMWEHGEAFGAMLVFAEHRYYGYSIPIPGSTSEPLDGDKLRFLTMEQALADYAVIIDRIKLEKKSPNSAVVGFGGSYGGMLAAWLRMKYPGSIDGAIAASAPILAFQQDSKKWDTNLYWQVVTNDATPNAGARAGCDTKVRSAWNAIRVLGQSEDGRALLKKTFRLCSELKSESDVERLVWMMVNAWDTMAMGNFPFRSDYLVFQQTQLSNVTLPAWPVRVACERLLDNDGLDGMREAAAVLYNVTESEPCFDLPEDPNFDGIWDYQWCTELLPQETYFSLNGTTDMFWPRPMNMSAIEAHCKSTVGVTPRSNWIHEEFQEGKGATNIVFSNGLLDPWHSGGVLTNQSSSILAVVIPEGAHHLDLMFSQGKLDPASVVAARKFEMANVAKWIERKKQIH